MRLNTNEATVSGYLQGFGRGFRELKLKVSDKPDSKIYGKEFISGTLEISTDPEGMNIIAIEFPCVLEYYKSGKKNNTFTVLKELLEAGDSVLRSKVGPQSCAILSVTKSTLKLEEWYDEKGENLSASQGLAGGFVTRLSGEEALNPQLSERSTFHADVLFSQLKTIETDNGEDYDQLRGFIFNGFSAEDQTIAPCSFAIRNKLGMQYFENHDWEDEGPLYLEVWGDLRNVTTYTEKTIESAWGDAIVEQVPHHNREWLITRAKGIPYELGAEGVLTAEEFEQLKQARARELAAKRADRLNREAAKKAPAAESFPVTAPNKVKSGSFNPGAFNMGLY